MKVSLVVEAPEWLTVSIAPNSLAHWPGSRAVIIGTDLVAIVASHVDVQLSQKPAPEVAGEEPKKKGTDA